MRSGAQSAINAVGQSAFTFTQLNVHSQFSIGKGTVDEVNCEITDSFLKNIKHRYVCNQSQMCQGWKILA